jgi:O-antigen biosynthesis protein WbqV
LLARSPVKLDVAAIRRFVTGKRVLITGGGGSIGSELCRQVAALGCAHVTVLEQCEYALFKIDMEMSRRHASLSRGAALCDVRDSKRVHDWFLAERPDVIFHAAALKHVHLVEQHPAEGVLTNVVGTWNVAEAASACGAKHMVLISTDKAVAPSCVMGATKRIAESVIRAQRNAGGTQFSVVRFGNGLGSAGSVVPIFQEQIERGGPVTITDPDVERFFMTIPEAVQLVLHATAQSALSRRPQPTVFVLDMGKPVKIYDLAKRMIEFCGKIPGKDIAFEFIGLRPGEKLTEDLIDSTESTRPTACGVLEVIDDIAGTPLTRARVAELEAVARWGDGAAIRNAIFSVLDAVRTPMRKAS